MEINEHYSTPHLALWKSCAIEVLEKAKGADKSLLHATDSYLKAIETNSAIPNPGTESTDDKKVGAYLSYLHHRKAHAKIAADKNEEAKLEKQIAEFKFGNPLWQRMFEQYYKYYWQYPYHQGAQPAYRSWQDPKFGNNNLQYGVIDWKLPSNATIAIVGDIGTGTVVAENVLRAVCKFKPDAILHVGDVYFSGTKREIENWLVKMIQKVLKEENLNIPFFTIPGNHEYFTGNVALLNALDSNKLVCNESQKQQTSYFCLKTEDDGWQFLAMDTGYNGHYMNVAKGALKSTLEHLHIGEVKKPEPQDFSHWPKNHNPYYTNSNEANLAQKDTTSPVAMVTIRPDELLWHQDKLKSFNGRTILMSHHQLYSALQVCGLEQSKLNQGQQLDPNDANRAWINTELWAQFGPYLKDKVAVWLWGHEHNLLIFEDNYRPLDWPITPEFTQAYQNLRKGRCVGHSALPVQDIEEPYKKIYPVNLINDHVKLDLTKVGTEMWYNHGFQIMQLAGKGNPSRLSYFQVASNNAVPQPLFMEIIN